MCEIRYSDPPWTTYVLFHASDVQFTQETQALYRELEGSVKDIRVVVDHVLSE